MVRTTPTVGQALDRLPHPRRRGRPHPALPKKSRFAQEVARESSCLLPGRFRTSPPKLASGATFWAKPGGGFLPWGPSATRDPHGPTVRGGRGDGGRSADQGPPLGLPCFVDGAGRQTTRFPLSSAEGLPGWAGGGAAPGQRERARG